MRFLCTRLFWPIFLFAASIFSLQGAPNPTVEVKVGDNAIYELKDTATRINIRQLGVVDLFLPQPKQLSISGLLAGLSRVTIQYQNGDLEDLDIIVSATDQESLDTLTNYLRSELDQLEGVTVTKKDKTVEITGNVDERERNFYLQTISFFPAMIDSKVSFVAHKEEELANFLKRALAGIDGLAVQAGEKDVTLSGKVDERYQSTIETVLNSFGSEAVNQVTYFKSQQDVDEEMKKTPPTIQIDVEVVEVSLTYLRNLGIEWFSDGGASLSGTFLVTGEGSSFATQSALNLTDFKAQIQAMVGNGNARILATPKLTVQSGKDASFLVGGEVPIVSTTANASSVEYKRFGTQLDITPVYQGEDEIQVKLKATLSSLDYSQAAQAQGNPTIQSKEASTDLLLRDGQTFAMAGLIKREQSESENKVPLLGDIPLLGGLFRSTETNYSDTETLILVTPHVLKEADPKAPAKPRTMGSEEIRRTQAQMESERMPSKLYGNDGDEAKEETRNSKPRPLSLGGPGF